MIAKVEGNKLVFKIEDSFQLFGQSFNRIKYFLPITENMDSSCFPDQWRIEGKQGLQHMVKAPENKKDKEMILDGFKHFTSRYLLRDCIESFALGLDHLYSLLMLRNKKLNVGKPLFDCLTDEELMQLKDFERVGLYRRRQGKVQKLKKDFGLEITDDHRKVISGLKGIRDCLSHNNGIVMDEYGVQTANPDEREFSWLAFSMHAAGAETGKKFEIKIGEQFPEAVNIMMELKPHSKVFKRGEHLVFSSCEVFEIAYSLNLTAAQYVEGTADLFKSEKAA